MGVGFSYLNVGLFDEGLLSSNNITGGNSTRCKLHVNASLNKIDIPYEIA